MNNRLYNRIGKYVHHIIECCNIVGPVVRPQMMVNNYRANVPPPPASFPNPIQRPGGHSSAPRAQRPAQKPAEPSSKASDALKAQQAKERKGLLAHAQNFLNPQNKPSIKHTSKGDSVSTGTEKKSGSSTGVIESGKSLSEETKSTEEK